MKGYSEIAKKLKKQDIKRYLKEKKTPFFTLEAEKRGNLKTT